MGFSSSRKGTPAEIQLDIDRFLKYYNLERSHQVLSLSGRMPTKALRDALAVAELPPLVCPEREEAEPAA